MASALEGFLRLECDKVIAGWLRGAVAEAAGRGYDDFDLNLFEVELFHAENRVTIKEVAALATTQLNCRSPSSCLCFLRYRPRPHRERSGT